MIRKVFLSVLTLFIFLSAYAQEKPTFNLYGLVRGDLYINSRKNVDALGGTFSLFPLRQSYDAQGKDLNAVPDLHFSSVSTRLGVDVQGVRLGKAQTSAKIEVDLAGTGDLNFVMRIRHAYVNFDWENGSSLLLGQTWHPMFGDLYPDVINLCTGAPFQAFNRSPMFRYRYNRSGFTLTAATMYQVLYRSFGPEGVSNDYLRNSMIPELFVGLEYKYQDFTFGAGYNFLSLKPRTESLHEGEIYKVNERVNSGSFEVHAAYQTPLWFIMAKSGIASNMAHANMIGGYGVKTIDAQTGKREYTPFKHSTSWFNALYGKEWKFGVFAGYTKSLGSSDSLSENLTTYGRGLDVNQLVTGSLQGSYNKANWSLGFEYSLSSAWYGDIDIADGKVGNTHSIINHRLAGLFIYKF